MTDHRWQGHTHSELFTQIHQGAGPDASTAAVLRWTELSRELDEIDAGVAAAMNAARGRWEGSAADSAQDGLRPLGEWTRTARDAAERMRACAEHQAELVARARAEMPPPVPVTAEDPGTARSLLVHLFGGQTDYEVQEARSDAAERRAFEVMRTYQAGSEANTTSLASFPAPPQVVVDAPPAPAPGQGQVGRQAVTITWTPSTVPNQRAPSNTTRRGTPTPRPSGSARPGSRSPGTARPGARGGTATSGGSRPTSRRRETDDTDVDRSVTEEHGEPGGLFDEHRTASRPVIGGDPG